MTLVIKKPSAGKLVMAKASVPGNQTVLLLHGSGSNGSRDIVDSSPRMQNVRLEGDTQITTARSKFGSSSIAFDGTGDAVVVKHSSDLVLDGPFCIEVFVYLTAYGSSGTFLFNQDGGGFEVWVNSSGVIRVNRNGNTNLITTSSGAFGSTGAWKHFAFTWDSSTFRVFIDGVLVGSVNSAAISSTGGDLIIGNYRPNSNYGLNGNLQEVRISRIARYTANFTPPTAPFPDF